MTSHSESASPSAASPPTRISGGTSFEQIAAGFHLGPQVEYARWFVGVLENEIAKYRDQPASSGSLRVLDVGCGIGMGRDGEWTRHIATLADEVWGVEPDTKITPQAGVFHSFQHAMLETADLPESHFDLIYSFQVIEHVSDPGPFMAAAYKALKPGGTHLFYTINGRHYFARIASLIRKIKLDELILKAIVGEEQFEHQYPVAYKLNTEKQINQHAMTAGFAQPDYAYLDRFGPKPYMKGPLVIPWWCGQKWRSITKNPRSLLGLIARMRKPE